MRYLLPHLIDDAAERSPERPAVRCRDEQLDYGELAARANALAHVLTELGVRRGDRVGIQVGVGQDGLTLLARGSFVEAKGRVIEPHKAPGDQFAVCIEEETPVFGKRAALLAS